MNGNRQEQMDRIRHYAAVIEKQSGKAVRPYRSDGYVNLMNRYGTQKDTSEHYKFVAEPTVPDDLLTMFYEGNGLFAKIIDAPAEEAVKHGFSLKEVSDQEVERFYQEALDELDWEETATTAVKWARLFGGSIAVMLINDGRGIDEPLDWKNIKSVDDIRVYDRSLIQPDYKSMFSYDPRDPFSTRGSRLGMPEHYYVSSKYGNFAVHDSRCLVFQNGILPENTTNSIYQLWGMPEYIRIKKAIRDAELAHGSAPKMLDRSVQAVYKMKDLSQLLASEEGEDLVLKRLQTIDMARGLLNSITIDNDNEDYDFRQFQFAGVSDVIDSTCNFLSALTNIPQTVLFGRSPAGMNATGTSDMENYYNYVGRIQKRMLRSNLRYLLSILFQAGLSTGEVKEVPKINVEFSPLWSLSELEKADLENKKASTAQVKAQTAQIYVDMQALDPSEVRKKLADDEEFDVENILDEVSEEDLLAALDPDDETAGNAPEAAPEATKLPQDMDSDTAAKLPKGEAEASEPNPINKDAKPFGVGVIVVKKGKILTGTRHNDTGYGLICGPGGHGEEGETPEQAAIREAEEEFSIKCKGLVPIGLGPLEPESSLQSHLFICTDFEGTPATNDMEMVNIQFRSMDELEKLKPSLFPPFADSLEILKDCLGSGKLFDENGNEVRGDGGPGSGNHGHKGVPGQVGGSAPGSSTSYGNVSGETCKEYGKILAGKTKAQIGKMAAKDPELKALTDTISLYAQGGYAEQRKVAEKLVNGTYTDADDFTVGGYVNKHTFYSINDVYKGQGLAESSASTADGMAKLIGAVNESEPYQGELYRAAQDRGIIKVGGDYEPFVVPEIGQTIQISAPTSFTTDKAVADKLMGQKMGDRIFYTIEGGASAVDVSKLSPYKQKEMLTCGTYEVVSVDKRVNGRNHIYGGEPTSAQKKRGLVDYYGTQVYETYDVEIRLRQVGKVAIGTKFDGSGGVIFLSPEHFEGRMIDVESEKSGRLPSGEEHKDGGPGSGNHGHKGVPGQVGGSAPTGAGLSESVNKAFASADEDEIISAITKAMGDMPVGSSFDFGGSVTKKIGEDKWEITDPWGETLPGKKSEIIESIAYWEDEYPEIEFTVPSAEKIAEAKISAGELKPSETSVAPASQKAVVEAKSGSVAIDKNGTPWAKQDDGSYMSLESGEISTADEVALSGGEIAAYSGKLDSGYGRINVDAAQELYSNAVKNQYEQTGEILPSEEFESMLMSVKAYGLGGQCQEILSAQDPETYKEIRSMMSDERKAECAAYADSIERFISLSDKMDAPVYRGMGFNSTQDTGGNLKKALDALTPGADVSFGHIASWSSNKGTSESYAYSAVDAEFEEGENYAVIYTVPSPKSVVSLRGVNPEGECLSPKDARFRVSRVDYSYDEMFECHRYSVRLEEI